MGRLRSRAETLSAPLGGVRLSVPLGYRGRWLSDPGDRAQVTRWTLASREGSAYNTPSYVEFAREQNGRADLLWLTREGNPVLGLPLHPLGNLRISTGYAGVMFPDGPRDASLRRGVAALIALLAANRRMGFEILQSAQAPAYDDPGRVTGLAFQLACNGLEGPSLYSRILELEPLTGGSGADPDVRGELLLEHGLRPYEGELRSQVRQALRHGLHASCSVSSTDAQIQATYDEFTALHQESWRRTGMTPHRLEYWTALARAIVDGGGRDVVVWARDADGTALAAVNCHLRGDRALYWAGASSERGLSMRANPLCLHAAIQACRQLGVRHFELGRFHPRECSQKERAITRYKAQFGGDLVRVVGFNTRPATTAVAVRRALGLFGFKRERRNHS